MRYKEITSETVVQNREQAGRLLGQKLMGYEKTNTIVVGIPHGGVCVASEIADFLHLPLEVIPCRKVRHPADRTKYIGSVSSGEACIHEGLDTIPQDYIAHQLSLIRAAIEFETKFYYGERPPASLLYKTIILVDDILDSSDSMIACLRAIKKQMPLKIVVAVPVVTAEAARMIKAEADDFIFLRMDHVSDAINEYFIEFPKVDKTTVRQLLNKSKERNSQAM